MKALPKLSKAQQEAWARILEWRSTYRLARSFRAGGTAGWRDNLENSVATSDATLKALTRKGLLISAGEKFGFNRYMVNPDYLPDSEPAAEPESEPVAVEYEVGDKVVPNYGMWKNAVCTVDEKYWDQGGVTRYVLKNAVGQIGIIRYKADELEPAASEPATDDRPTSDDARLIDSITEARIERDLARNENANLANQLEALRVRFAELESENGKLRDENTHLLAALDFWRPKDERATGSKL